MKSKLIIPILLLINSCFSQNKDNNIDSFIYLAKNSKFAISGCDSIRRIMHQLYFKNISQSESNLFAKSIDLIIEDSTIIYDGANSCNHLKLIARSVLASFKYHNLSDIQKFHLVYKDCKLNKYDKGISKLLILRISEELELESKIILIDSLIRSNEEKLVIGSLVDGEIDMNKRNYLQHYTLYISRKLNSPDYLKYLRAYSSRIIINDFSEILKSKIHLFKLNNQEVSLKIISEIQNDLEIYIKSNE